jgi:ankyrin repeat protein
MRKGGVCWLMAAVVLLGGCDKKPRRDGPTALRQAVWSQDVGQVQRLIVSGVPVNAKDYTGRTALHEAAQRGSTEMLEVLIRCGALVDSLDDQGRTPVVAAMESNRRAAVECLILAGAAVNLHLAVYLGDVAQVKNLIAAAADVNAKGHDGKTPLDYAASYGQVEVARLLLAAGANPNAIVEDKEPVVDRPAGTPLYYAVQGDHKDMVELLLDSGADANAKGRYGATVLYWSAETGRLDMVKLLIAKGANPNIQMEDNDFCDGTSLGVAIEHGYVEVAEALILGGADVNGKNDSGWTPLHTAMISYYSAAVDAAVKAKYPTAAAQESDWDNYVALAKEIHQRLSSQMVRLLIAHGADVKAKDKEGMTPLHCAAYFGDRNVVQLLLAEGAEVNARTVRDPKPDAIAWERDLGYRLGPGVTPLHEAVAGWDPGVVELLLAHGADVRAADEAGMTALHKAAAKGRASVTQLLLARGAEVNAKDGKGATPLAYALPRGHVKTAKMLIASGAEGVDVKKHLATTYREGAYVEVPPLHEALSSSSRPQEEPSSGKSDPNDRAFRREWVELLLANGADPNERDQRGDTPLHSAVLLGNDELASLFITHGTGVNARNRSNLAALHYAAAGGRTAIVAELVAKGAEVNARDDHGDTPLHAAALRGHTEVVEVLVSHGADVSVKNSRGRTPLDEAIRQRRADVVQLLAAKATGTNAGVQDGRTRK